MNKVVVILFLLMVSCNFSEKPNEQSKIDLSEIALNEVEDTVIIDTVISFSVYEKQTYKLKHISFVNSNYKTTEGLFYVADFNDENNLSLKRLLLSDRINNSTPWIINFDERGSLSSITLIKERENPGFYVQYMFTDKHLNKIIIDDTIAKNFDSEFNFSVSFFDSINRKHVPEDKILANFPWHFISGFYLEIES